jgi:hypothetical protein
LARLSHREGSRSRYWQSIYDWRKLEKRLNSLPQFVTEIDGVDIHFIHVRSKHPKSLPIIITHGWPGSVIEQLKVIDPLTNPTAHGGSAADAWYCMPSGIAVRRRSHARYRHESSLTRDRHTSKVIRPRRHP